MRRLDFIEFLCIVAIGMAMVEFAAGDRQVRETNASVLAAKLSAVADAGVPRAAVTTSKTGSKP
jgi:hypothetical protein